MSTLRPCPIGYVFDMSRRTCFPENFDTANLINVTSLTDEWAKFVYYTHEYRVDIDCAVFADLATRGAL
jgi:hypothetical protein